MRVVTRLDKYKGMGAGLTCEGGGHGPQNRCGGRQVALDCARLANGVRGVECCVSVWNKESKVAITRDERVNKNRDRE